MVPTNSLFPLHVVVLRRDAVAMTQEYHLFETVDHQIFFPKAVLYTGSLELFSCVKGVGIAVGCPVYSIHRLLGGFNNADVRLLS